MLAVALHRQLLEVGREALEVLLIRQHGHRLRAEEVRVPDRQQAHQDREVSLEGGGAEMLVHLAEPVEQGLESIRADGQHGGQPDGRIHRVAPPYPVPEAKHVRQVDAELLHLVGIGGDGDEVLGDRLPVSAETGQQPIPGIVRVGHRLQSGERLRRDDEQRVGRLQVPRRLDEVRSVHVGDEAERHRALAAVLERLVGHHRPQVGPSDANVDDVADLLAGVAPPGAAADALGEGRHPVEDLVHRGHHVLAVQPDGCASRRPQGDVQHGPLLGDVDFVAAKHRVDAPAQVRLLCQLHQQLEGLLGDSVLRVVEVDAGCFDGQTLAPRRVRREEVPQVQARNLPVVSFQGSPGRALPQWREPLHRLLASHGLSFPSLRSSRAPGPSLPSSPCWRSWIR